MKNLTNIIILFVALLLGAATDGYAQSKGPVIKGNVYGGGENAKVVVLYTYEEYIALPGKSSVGKDAFDALPLADKIKPLEASTEVKLNNGEVYGDIYGGGALADVEGSTKVTIDEVSETQKGKFAGSVFGGGMGKEDGTAYANVKGNATVEVNGGEIIWNKAWDKDGKVWKEWDSEKTFFFNDKFLQRHNIYAGGNYASIIGTWSDANTLSDTNTGTSRLKMTRGLIGSDLLNSDEWKLAFAQHEDPHFYAFGGGYGIYTKAHESDVNICLPMVGEEGVGGGEEQLVRPQRRAAQTLPLDIITDNYGVAWTTVLGILGGGYNGHVEQTNVLVGDATYAHRVYGGGLGSYEGWTQSSAKGTPNTSDVTGYVGTTGKLPLTDALAVDLQTTHVTLAGGHIHGEVFGGGAGVASREVASVLTDFTEIARVKGNTLVETTSYETYLTSEGTKETLLAEHPNKDASKDDYPLKQRAQVFGHVYGGGDVANVSGNTNVKLFGGDVFGYTFGAGLGRLTTQAKDYTRIGNVTGSSTLTTADLVDWDGDWRTGYDEPYKPTAWNDVYGGGRNGVTNGNAEVNIKGGKLGNNIFGGGLGNVDGDDITSADVLGNTTVNVTGGSYQWREMADVNGNKKEFIDNETVTQSELLSRMGFEAKLEPVKDFFSYRDLRYTRDHSIYGGGNVACNVGTYDSRLPLADVNTGLSTVNMNHGLFADKDISFIDEDFNIATLCRYLACNNSENTQFGVFGGGYGANTKVSETEVNLNMGQSKADIDLWAEYFGEIQTWYTHLSDEDKKSMYGGSSGENAYNRYFTARMAKSINVPSHTVLTAAGGGLAGYVAGNTSVTMDGHSGALRVFGGGIGMKPDDLEALNPISAADLTYGQVGGNTKVDVQAGVVVQNVYGGGAGVESQRKEDDSYLDFPGMAHVLGKTDVRVGGYSPGTVVFGKVYGGGDVANVGTTPVTSPAVVADPTGSDLASASVQTKVTIDGGCVFQQVFAGGSGRTKNVCHDYTKLGAVFGNTQLVIKNSTYTAEQAAAANLAGTLVTGWTNKSAGDTNEPWLWDIVYGGGQNGTVYGNTDVQINGGNLGYDIFGGGWGYKTTATGPGDDGITSADVTQNTNVRIAGGKWCLSQSWDGTERRWNAAKTKGGNTYSPQYDPDYKKFNIDHNVYGGGNVACVVGTYNNLGAITSGGKAYVYVTKGMLVENASLGHDYTGLFFEQPEWENIYKKHASPHFSIFGGGYGFDTKVENTFVKVDMGTDSPKIAPSASSVAAKEPSEKFVTQQSLMDVIGGGFQGGVNNTCNVNIDGYTFMRNAFGGAYYATVGNTDVTVTRANMDNVFGGGMMGDVKTNVNVKIGTEGDYVADINSNLIINQDVYGANDVAGYVGAVSRENGDVDITPDSEGVKLKLNGGHVFGSVYGGGNGDYLYQIDDEVSMVTVQEDVEGLADDPVTLYKVPLRASDFPSLMGMSDQQKMANVISYRPATMKVDIDFKGNSAADRLLVDGNIFGGGNSATITDFDGNDTGEDAKVHMNVGSHIILGGVYLGSDGEALFESKKSYMTLFPKANNLQLFEHIDWDTPENQSIPVKFLPTPKEKRPEIYKNNIDLYFMPVEMALMPEVTWGKARQNNSVNLAREAGDPLRASYTNVAEDEDGLTDAEIGTFCCGGNRGNMDTKTNFHINFPEGLTITDKIVGGCNNANYQKDIYDPVSMTVQTLDHTGGFLLGSHGVGTGRTPQIHLTLRNKFKITEKQTIEGIEYYAQKGNVFGGCYERGVVRGDILLEVYSNMLHSGRTAGGEICGLDSAMLRRTTDKGITVASIYGAGYGPESWVRGDTEVRLGDETHSSILLWNTDGTYNATKLASSCNYLFGGGRQGNVIGNTNVQVRNGRVAGCVVGASYAGTLYGSAQTMVGFPEVYYRAQVSRSYDILRADEDPVHAEYLDDRGNKLIQKKVYYTKGDLVTATAYNAIRDRIVEDQRLAAETAHTTFDKTAAVSDAETQLAAYFDKEHSIPANNDWSKVNILIDKAIYGGGYALASGSGSYTVMKYKGDHKFLDTDITDTYLFNNEAGWENALADFTNYGGNTFVIVGDVSENYDEMAETTTDFTLTGGHAAFSSIPDNQKDHDHIRLSSSQLNEVALSIGDDLFGLFKELTNREANPTKYDDDDGWDKTPERIAEGNELSGQYLKITAEAVYTTEEKNNKFFEFVGEGGIYGDGRLSISEGFRICDVIGYGYNGSTPKTPSLMNCIHRFDIARFKDCCISLLGDRDYTSDEGSQIEAVAYSMARVSEILMESAIDQRSDYKTLDQKHSRNYVGLSSAQFDLAAVKSNDVFSDDYSEAALYHNKWGELVNTSMDIEGTEDDNGGSALKFPKEMSYYDVKKWYLSEYNTGISQSGYYDDATAQVRNERQFQLRNSATARNMFGIFSGYALNVHSTHYVGGLPQPYYGPVVGVFEVDLIGTRAGEAGGYAYAQNIHREITKDKDDNDVHSFLETSGNFVFPATVVRKVIDNCTPTLYNSIGRDAAEGHYWYVTGFKYYYNTTITGYTYDGKTKFFESDNSTTKRLVLNGTKAGQTVVLQNFHWLPRHTDPYYKTAAEYNQAWGTALTEGEFNALPEEKKAKCDIEHYYLTTKYNKENVVGSPATDIDAWNSIITADDRINTPYYNLSLSLSEFGNYMEKNTDDSDVPHLSLMPQDTYDWSSSDPHDTERYKIYKNQTVELPYATDRHNPVLGLRLADCMNNNGKDELGSYYSKHLEQPCVAKIVLTTPAKNESGDPIYSAYAEVQSTTVTNDTRDAAAYADDPYYTIDINGDYKKITTLGEAKTLAGSGIILFETQKEVYDKVGDRAYNSSETYYTYNGATYEPTSVADESDYDSQKLSLYYLKTPAAHPENYVYDITLTIKYIKGPSYSGHIDIKNCALPGEMIRISHENLRVESDETSLPHNGSFWTIGPGKKVLNDPLDESKGYHWELIDETGTKERDAFDASGKPIKYYYNDPDTRNLYFPYNPYVNDPEDKFYSKVVTKQQDKAVSPIMRLGAYHDFVSTDKPDYFIPAYYFMNGYVAQYSFTVNGIDEVFTTTIHPEDTLLVHNYHRMAKAADAVTPDSKDDIKLSHAMTAHSDVPGIDDGGLTSEQKKQMTADWQAVHKRPRVYIQDVEDFMAFGEYLKRDDDDAMDIPVLPHVDGSTEPYLPEYLPESVSYVRRYATAKGQDVEFFLMNDIDLTGKTWTAPDFEGILHGNGHVIKGLKNTQSLFAKLGEDVCIYNLGMTKGKIASNKGDATYRCSYTYDTNEEVDGVPVHYVYRMDGSGFTGYDEDDWRSGRVAYDLNEFYLAERLDRHTDAVSDGTNNDTHTHDGYVEQLYEDGEYRFSRWSNNENNSEYLRSKGDPNYQWAMGIDQDLIEHPDLVSNHYYHYDNEHHVISHKVDEPRAYYDLTDPLKPVLNEYRPLIDEALYNTAVEPAPAIKKNDYIFFGQTVNNASYTNDLGTVGSTLPNVIDASSRAGQTSGLGSYEGVTHNVDGQANRLWRAYGFYQSKLDDAFHFNRAAWAVNPYLTAIDFTGQHDVAPNHEWIAGYAPAAKTATSMPIFYPMVMDIPTDEHDALALTSFNVDSNKDIAPYSNASFGHVTQNLLVYNNGESVFNYNDKDESSESVVPYHNLKFSGSPAVASTDYFHLVDKQDFNAPIAFNVNTRAWYERLPQAYRNVDVDKGYGAGTAWEGIVLPFTATKVTAAQGVVEAEREISHFYGSDDLHHEYWLRGLTAVDGEKATFARPAVSGSGNFVDNTKQSGAEYTYPKNEYFTNLYNYNPWFDTRDDEGEDTFGNHNKAWYAEAHTFDNYVHLTADVPYIVAFPGDDFYEFSMESYYKTGEYGNEPYKQKATFEVNSDDPDIVATTIKVSDDNEAKTIVGGKVHWGTFMHEVDQLGINKDGTAFETVPVSYNDGYVLPFRTYLGAESSPVKRYVISEPGKGDQPFEPNEPNANDNRPVFDISIDGLNVTVTSSYEDTRILDVYMVGGQLVLRHEAVPGTTHFRLPQQGAYIIGRKKYMVR